MPLSIVRNDICRMRVDAIVNAANEGLRQGGGVCGAIFAAAGVRKMRAACEAIGHCDTGSAVVTTGFSLPARYVIHAVGPVWRGGGNGEVRLLRSCYLASLKLALELGCESVACPLISSGSYGYPKDAAIDVALGAIRSFLDEHEMDVYLVLFDVEALRATGGRFGNIAEYIDDTYVERSPFRRRGNRKARVGSAAPWRSILEDGTSHDEADEATLAPDVASATDLASPSAPAPAPQASPSPATPQAFGTGPAPAPRMSALKRLLSRLDEPFSTTLLRMIDERGLKDSEVYKRANMSRQHFSKIRNNPAYRPKKQTVLALAVALRLTLDETSLLLERAGYALTHADERDVIVEYFIRRRQFDIYEINLALYAFDQPLLG